MLGEKLGVPRRVDQQDPVLGEAELETVEQLLACRVGDDQLAVDVADLLLQRRTPSGGIDAHDRGTGQRRPAQPEQELRLVVEQNADVERAIPAQRVGHGRTVRALADDLVPRPGLLPRTDTGAVVTEPVEQQLSNDSAVHHCYCPLAAADTGREGVPASRLSGLTSTQCVPP